MHLYEVRRRTDHRGLDLISDALPFGRLWYGEPNAVSNAIGYAMHSSRSHHAVIRVYDDAGDAFHGWDAALTPTGFREIVSDDFPVLHTILPLAGPTY
jgi:hypothetical protein